MREKIRSCFPEIILFVVTLLPTAWFALQPENTVIKWFHNDDAYYYFVTARNIANGLGSTFDGIAPTNGYHPLWMLFCIPIFGVFDADLITPLRVVILVQALLTAGTAVVMFRFLKKILPVEVAVLGGLFWAAAPSIHTQIAVGGLETGLNAFLLTLLFAVLHWSLEDGAGADESQKRILWLGVIAGLTVLARLDNIFPAAFAGLWLIVRRWKIDSDMYGQVWRRRIREYLAYGLPAVVLVGGYLLFNQASFGGFMPVSGQVKHWWGATGSEIYGRPPETLRDLYYETFTSRNRSLVPWSYIYINSMDWIERINGWLVAVGLPALMRTRWFVLLLASLLLLDFRFAKKAVLKLGLIPLFLGSFGQIAYYKLSGHVATRTWYWVMELFFTVLFMMLLLAVLARLVRKLPKGAYLSLAVFGVLSALVLWKHGSWLVRYSEPYDPENTPIARAQWITANTEEDALIGLTGSGSAGYYTVDRTIVNLDGLISSYEYFEHLKAGTAHEYLEDIGLDYVMGGAVMVEEDPYKGMFMGRVERVGTIFEDEPDKAVLWAFRP